MDSIKLLAKTGELDVQVDLRKLKVNYRFIHSSEYDDEDEESKTQETFPLMISATVFKVNEHKYCIDFFLKSGERASFLEHF